MTNLMFSSQDRECNYNIT